MPAVIPVAGSSDFRRRYRAPDESVIARVPIQRLVEDARTITNDQLRRLPGHVDGVFCVGERALVKRKCIAIVGSREVSSEGAARARKLAKQLVEHKIVVMSGLAEGVDENAHRSAIESGGETVAVIGTPLDKVYPAKHAELQERIYREHLLISPFASGTETRKSSFPERNKLMAALADGTCIIEATDVSGSLHQAAECVRLGRFLFILKSVVENRDVTWPRRFLDSPDATRVKVVETVEDILGVIL